METFVALVLGSDRDLRSSFKLESEWDGFRVGSTKIMYASSPQEKTSHEAAGYLQPRPVKKTKFVPR